MAFEGTYVVGSYIVTGNKELEQISYVNHLGGDLTHEDYKDMAIRMDRL